MKDTAIRLLDTLTQAHGAPGFEGDVRALFELELSGLPVSTDPLGNTVATLEGSGQGPRVMVTGHFDEVGFLVQAITDRGLIKFISNGGWWSHTLLAQRVRIQTALNGEILGVIGSTPVHFLNESDRNRVMPLEQMFIDIGATSRDDVETFGIRPGDPVVPEAGFTRLANPNWLMSKAFDNRVGIAATIQTLQHFQNHPLPCQLFGTGTVQEEIGARGAMTVANRIQPDVALVMEGSPADDGPGMDLSLAQGRVGAGVQIRLADATAIMDRPLAHLAIETAKQEGIPYQIAVRSRGGTDARSFQAAQQGTRAIVLGVPARYIHTHNALIHVDDYLATVRLAIALVNRLDQSTFDSLSH